MYNDDGPEVVEEGISGWVWNADLRGAVFYRDMYRYDTGRLAFLKGKEEVILSVARSAQVFPDEVSALLALASRHEQRAARAQGRCNQIRQRIATLARA